MAEHRQTPLKEITSHTGETMCMVMWDRSEACAFPAASEKISKTDAQRSNQATNQSPFASPDLRAISVCASFIDANTVHLLWLW